MDWMLIGMRDGVASGATACERFHGFDQEPLLDRHPILCLGNRLRFHHQITKRQDTAMKPS